MRGPALALVCTALLVAGPVLAVEESVTVVRERTVNLFIPAVGQAADGTFFGVLSALELRVRSPGRGDVFVRTEPLADLDMQGAARLAVQSAGEITGQSVDESDFHFTITTDSPIIGGPSAGAAMTVAAAAALMNWPLDEHVAITGMIDPDLSVGPVGGIYHKAEALSRAGVKTFLVPSGQSVETVTLAGAEGLERRRIDLVQHARETWDMTVVEVGDLYDAIPHFTGLRVQRPSTGTDPLQEQAYQDLMEALSQAQGANASRQHEAARAAYLGLPASVSSGDRREMEAALAASSSALGRAGNATTAGRPYQASSYSFQSLVQSRYVLALAGFFNQPLTVEAYTRQYVAALTDELSEAEASRTGTYPMTAGQWGAQAAMELRAAEARQLQDQATAAVESGSFALALRHASYARERVGGVHWWAQLRDRLPQEAPSNVTEEAARSLAREYEANAALMIQYARLVLAQAGADSTRLDTAEEASTLARLELERGHLAAGVFGQLQAIASVNAALATLNPESALSQRLHLLQERAAYDIAAARGHGFEPVYAVSQFEFALTLTGANPLDAYELLTVARMAARTTVRAAGFAPAAAEVSPAPQRPPLVVPADLRPVLTGLVVVVAGGWVVGMLWLTAMAMRPAPRGKK